MWKMTFVVTETVVKKDCIRETDIKEEEEVGMCLKEVRGGLRGSSACSGVLR